MTRIWLRENKLIWYLLNTRNRIFSILLIIIIFFFSFSFFLLNNMYTAMFPICYLLWSNNTKPSYQISPFHGWHTRETTWLFTAHFYTVLVIYIERGCWLNNLKIWLFSKNGIVIPFQIAPIIYIHKLDNQVQKSTENTTILTRWMLCLW